MSRSVQVPKPTGALAISFHSTFVRVAVLSACWFQLCPAQPAGGELGVGTRSDHWSLRALRRPPPPAVLDRSWPRTTIDCFILARLEQQQARPSPGADRHTLLRRVSYDLTGLPPSSEELRQFLSDTAPQAYERAVDRLLDSPRYGERWARHWLDAVHFAETHGHDQDRIRTNAWPYRDYLIRSFNADKPYARFIQEQLAGDVLYSADPQATVALGFIAAGPWDESSLRDIREDTIDRQIARYIDRDDMVTTTMSTFTSTTVHCARCHDHKFDPIPQEDYYALQAVFAGVDRANRPYDPDPRRHALRQELLRRQRALENRETAVMDSLLGPAVQAEMAGVLRTLTNEIVVWTPLIPVSAVASNGTVLTSQQDGSWLASGPRPEKDTYVITAETDLTGITGVRLEVLTDQSLPHLGPGRQDNGNLHLSEFKLFVEPRKPRLPDPEPAPGGRQPWPVQRATADFNQDGWTVAHSVDGQEKTAWGIYPQVGKTHHAVFELKGDAGFADGTRLTVVLEQNHGGGHLIGRPRLSITSSPRPVRARELPDSVAAILQAPETNRTPEQRRELARYCLGAQIRRELAALGPPEFVYAGASDFVPDGGLVPAKGPRTVQVLKRGDIHRPGSEAQPGALQAVRALESRFVSATSADEGARRAALARWLSDPRNPLTWRSIVNRVWHHHFGRGLVDTPNDFGRMGGTPSHPELLDWLAAWFLDQGGSLKGLHRLIVTSSVYRQSSVDRPDLARFDSDNHLLGRMNRTRLDAECLRDSLLLLSGQLDLRMGGPSDRQFALSPGIHVTPMVDYLKFDPDTPEGRRRGIYRFLFRTLPDPFMDSLDCPEGSQLTPARGASVTVLQALSLLNNSFVLRQSEHLAQRIAQKHRRVEDQVQAACELALERLPARAEAAEFAGYARRHGLTNFCRVLFNSNEFMFVD